MYLKKVEECRWSVAHLSGVLDYNYVTRQLKDNWDYLIDTALLSKALAKERFRAATPWPTWR